MLLVTLTFLKSTGHLICKMFLKMDLSNVIRFELQIFSRSIIEVVHLSSYQKAHGMNYLIAGNVNSHPLVKVPSFRLLLCTVDIFPVIVNRCRVGTYFETI